MKTVLQFIYHLKTEYYLVLLPKQLTHTTTKITETLSSEMKKYIPQPFS